MSGHDSKYFSTTKKGEIPELKEELNSQYKVIIFYFLFFIFYINYHQVSVIFRLFNLSRLESHCFYFDPFEFLHFLT